MVACCRTFAQHGGILQVLPEVASWVKKGQVYARIRNVFGALSNCCELADLASILAGEIVHVYKATTDAIVVGKSSNPVCMSGDRLVHFGIPGGKFEKNQQDGHR